MAQYPMTKKVCLIKYKPLKLINCFKYLVENAFSLSVPKINIFDMQLPGSKFIQMKRGIKKKEIIVILITKKKKKEKNHL